MRILSQSLKNREGEVAVALWEELGAALSPVAWIVTTIDRDDHEWRYTNEHEALRHFGKLREMRYSRAPRSYETAEGRGRR